MKKELLFTVFAIFIISLFSTSTAIAQKWTGKGDGTSWNDAANWDSNEVPGEGATVKMNKNYTITGTMPHAPKIIKILKDANIVFDLDMTIGNGVDASHCLSVGGGSNVTLGVEDHNRVFNFNTTKHALAVFGGSDNVNITIAKSSLVKIDIAGFGFNLGNTLSNITNNGTIEFGSDVTLGMKIAGNFTNNGKITGQNMKNKGLVLTGTFFNNGEFSYTAPNDSSKLLLIDTFASFQNTNKFSIQGGKDSLCIVVSGTFQNQKDAYLTVNSAGFKVNNTGVFVNSGLVTMDQTAFLNTFGTSTNNGFYLYASGRPFSEGVGTIVDNGLKAVTTVDAAENCTVDLAEEAYAWYFFGDSLGVAGDDGSFTFPAKSLPTDSATITTSLEGVNITVINICDDAVDGGGCGDIASPESLGNVAICHGEAIPTLKVKEAAGYVADWYDAETGGNLLHTGLEYTPDNVHSGDNTYYVQNREESTGCTSDRTAVVLTVNSELTLSADSTQCADDNNTYSVYLNTSSDYTITASAGTVDGTIISGIPVGTNVEITVTDDNSGCTSTINVASPECSVGTDDIFGDNSVSIYPTLVKNGVLNIDIKSANNNYRLNIISATGKTVKTLGIKGTSKVDVSTLNQGMYYINIFGDKIQKTERFLIIR